MARHVTRRGQSPEGGHRGSSGVASIAPRESKIRPDHAPESPQQIGSMISLLSPLPPPSLFPPAVVSAPDELVRGFAVGVVWMASKQLQLGFACTDLSLHSTAAFLASSVTSLSLPNRPTHRGRAKPAHRASLGVGQFLDAMDGGWASARRAQVFQAKRRPDRGGEPGGGATSPSDPVLLALARSPSRSWAGPARIPKRDPLTSPPCQPSNRPTPPSLSLPPRPFRSYRCPSLRQVGPSAEHLGTPSHRMGGALR